MCVCGRREENLSEKEQVAEWKISGAFLYVLTALLRDLVSSTCSPVSLSPKSRASNGLEIRHLACLGM
jgi:hypothetical protein